MAVGSRSRANATSWACGSRRAGGPLLDQRASELGNRGVKDVWFVCTDRLSGFHGGDRRCLSRWRWTRPASSISSAEPQLPLLAGAQGLRRRAATGSHRPGCRARQVIDELWRRGPRTRPEPPHCKSGNGPGTGWSRFSRSRQRIRRVVYTKNSVESFHADPQDDQTRGHFPTTTPRSSRSALSIRRAKRHRAPVQLDQRPGRRRIDFGNRIPD